MFNMKYITLLEKKKPPKGFLAALKGSTWHSGLGKKVFCSFIHRTLKSSSGWYLFPRRVLVTDVVTFFSFSIILLHSCLSRRFRLQQRWQTEIKLSPHTHQPLRCVKTQSRLIRPVLCYWQRAKWVNGFLFIKDVNENIFPSVITLLYNSLSPVITSLLCRADCSSSQGLD